MSEEQLVIKIGPAVTAEELDDGYVIIRNHNKGTKETITYSEFLDQYVEYKCMPASALKWLNSVLDQHLSVVQALGASDSWETDKSDYSLLTDDVLSWLIVPENQQTFVESMILGPRMNFDNIKALFEQDAEQSVPEHGNEQLEMFDLNTMKPLY